MRKSHHSGPRNLCSHNRIPTAFALRTCSVYEGLWTVRSLSLYYGLLRRNKVRKLRAKSLHNGGDVCPLGKGERRREIETIAALSGRHCRRPRSNSPAQSTINSWPSRRPRARTNSLLSIGRVAVRVIISSGKSPLRRTVIIARRKNITSMYEVR